MMAHKRGRRLFGTTTVGARGQVVIPAAARKIMKLKKADKLLVFGLGTDVIALTKLSALETFASHLENRLGEVRQMIKKAETK